MYVSGSANSLSDVVTAIFSALTNNGWTLNTDVIHKDDVHVRLRVVGQTIEVLGGTGVDEGDALTGQAPQIARVRAFQQAFTFPMTYEVHIFDDPVDEVYVILNYNVDFFQWIWFGQSIIEDLPGTGVWFTAPQRNAAATYIYIKPTGESSGSSSDGEGGFPQTHSCSPFGPGLIPSGSFGTTQNGFVQHGLDGESWNPENLPSNGTATLYSLRTSQMSLLPNTWNQETVLLPITAWRARGSNTISQILDLVNARYCRIDFHDPGEIITIGDEEWKLYPFYRKNAADRDVAFAAQHTGTLGFAIRYTGT